MTTCTGCGEVNPERARFCLGCGTALVRPAPAREVRKTVTVLFCDLVGSTALGEQLDPEVLREVLDRYFHVLRAEIEDHGGVVEKFIGDAVMAVFGIPVLHEDDALRAVRAAAAIPLAIEGLNAELESRFGLRLQVRLGVSTGEVVAGATGSGGQRLATGDAVNLAARLQSLADPGQVVLAEATRRLLRDGVEVEPLDPVAVKGKSERVRPWRLIRLDAAAGRPVRTEAALIGRTDELAALRSAFEEAVTTRSPRRRLVLGSAGVGKSRLLAEFLAGLPEAATVLRGRCLSYGQGITFWPVRELLGSAAGWTEDDTADQAVAKLADLMPGRRDAERLAGQVAQLLGLAVPTGEGVPAGLPEAFRAFAQLLDELARWGPLVVVVDDLHWSEPPLLDLLDHLLGRSSGPVLLLGGARPELLDTHPEWAAGDRLALEPLPAADAAVLLAELLAPGEPPAAVAEHVLAAAEGNPLFVEQLVAMLVDDGTLERDAHGHWALTRRLTPGSLPGTITTLLAARLERLRPAEQRELEAGAVIGRVFWRGAVAELAREAVGAEAGGHLQELVDRQLLTPESSRFAGDEAYKFRHVLIRDAAYAAMPKAERASAHERFADWLVAVAGERASEYDEILGYHLEQAVDLRAELGITAGEPELPLRAGRHLAAAARRAGGRGDIGTAIGLLTRAERHLVGEPGAHADVLIELSRSLTFGGRLDEAGPRLSSALREAERLGDADRVTRARLVEIELTSWIDPAGWDREAAEEVLRRAIAAFGETGDEAGLADAWSLLGRVHMDSGHCLAAADALEEAILHGLRSGRPGAAGMPAISLLMTLTVGPTPVGVASERLDRMASEMSGSLDVESQLLMTSAVLAAMQGRFDRAWQLLEPARRLLDELGVELGPVATAIAEYEIAQRQGRLGAAEAGLREGERSCIEQGDRGARSTILAMLAHVHVAEGRLAEARSAAELSRDMAHQDDVYSAVLWRTALAGVASSSGDHPAAAALAGDAVDVAAATDWLPLHGQALLQLAEVRHRAGGDEEGARAAGAALALFERKGDVASASCARALLDRLSPLPRSSASPA